jgi:hypothetical protein
MRAERKTGKLLSTTIFFYPSLNFQPSTLNYCSKQTMLFEAEIGWRTRALSADNDMIEQVNLH